MNYSENRDENLYTLDFYGDKINVVLKKENNEIYIVMRKVCENIGLSWATQRRKIQKHHRFQQGIIMAPITSSEGERTALFLHKPKFFLWLYSINPDKVAKNIRPKLIRYQDEVELTIEHYFSNAIIPKTSKQESTDVLTMISSQARMIAVLADEMHKNVKRIDVLENDMYQMKKTVYLNPPARTTKSYISVGQAQKLKEIAKRKGKTRQGIMKIWAKFKQHFNISKYTLLPEDLFSNAVEWIGKL